MYTLNTAIQLGNLLVLSHNDYRTGLQLQADLPANDQVKLTEQTYRSSGWNSEMSWSNEFYLDTHFEAKTPWSLMYITKG
jgi:hypothetical protein